MMDDDIQAGDNEAKIKKVIEIETPTEEQKKFKYGIIYLSYIPDGLTVKQLREIMSEFGELGRIYLEPEPSNATSKRKKYIEGWVEFKKKRVAKQVAMDLNGTELNHGKKHSILNGQIWSIKYLHKFKWSHLTDQMELDRASREQKRRSEMSKTKKQAEFLQKMTERSRIMRKKLLKTPETGDIDDKTNVDVLRSKQNKPTHRGSEFDVSVDKDLLSSIFKKVA